MMITNRTAPWLIGVLTATLLGMSTVGCSDDVEPRDNDAGEQQQDVDDDAGIDDAGDDPDTDTDPDSGDDPGDDPWDDPWDDDDDDEELPDLAVDEIRPDRGPLDGGTPFVLAGEGFTEETTVLFGSQEVETDLAEVGDGHGELTGTTPATENTGPVTIRVMDDETGEDTLPEGFTYVQPLQIDAISPETIDADGGAEVTIEGNGFTEETRVIVGDRAAGEHIFVDSTRLRFVAPPHQPGTRDVRVTNENESVVESDALTYLASVTVDRVEPSYGTVDGGDDVAIIGHGFDSSLSVFIDGTSANIDEVENLTDDTDAAIVTTPPGEAGVVDVRVETTGDGDLLEHGFAYLDDDRDAPVLDGVVPSSGDTSGGQQVYLTGQFDDPDSATVEFGDESVDIVDADPQVLTVETPAAAPGTVDVSVDDGEETLTASDAFTFYTPLEVDDISPNEGDADGGDEVTVTGAGFDSVVEVRLAGLSVNFEVVDDETIEFDTPAASPGAADLQLFTDDDRSKRVDEAFLFVSDLEIWNFTPTQGSTAGDTYVELHGTGFSESTEIFFGDSAGEDVELIDPNTLAVRTPAQQSGVVDVTASEGNADVQAPQRYTYFHPGAQTGGAWGNPVDGAVNVTVYAMMGGPIQDAFVMLSTDAGTEYKGLTNAAGQITLSGPDIYGEQTITATAHEHSSATVQYVDAENITIFLNPLDGDGDPPQVPPPPEATFHGELTGLEKLAPDPAPDELLMAIVGTTQTDRGSRLPDPGPGAQVYEDGEYSITTRVGDLALVAIGGIYNTTTEEFEPLWMGVERYLSAAEGGVYEVDLNLDIPLDSSIDLKFETPPLDPQFALDPWAFLSYAYEDPLLSEAIPNTSQATVYLDLGVDGIYGPLVQQSDRSEVITVDKLARLTGDLDDASYEMIAQNHTEVPAVFNEDQLEQLEQADQEIPTQTALPAVQAFVNGIDETGAMYSTPPMASSVGFVTPYLTDDQLEEVPTPAPSVEDNRLVQWELHGPVDPDLYYVKLYVISFGMEVIIWEAFVPGDADGFIFPDFPDLAAYELEDEEGEDATPMPYPGGSWNMEVIGLSEPDISVDNFTYDDLSLDSADSMSISGISVALPEETP